ncbi:MAG: MSMEG_4193 family putative phosphomutase [Litorilinea sp.]
MSLQIPADAVTYVLLIRHGENDWVGTDRLAGRTPHVHLNEKGREQALRIAEALAEQPVAAIYSSPLVRCIETAQPAAERLGLTVQEEPGVIEVDYGEWRGGNLKELSKLPEWQLVQHNPSSFRFPGGETLHEVQSRAVNTLESMRVRHPNQVVAIYSHGDVIRTTLAHYLGVHIDLFQRVLIDTASISALVFHGMRTGVLFMNYRTELPKFEIKREEDAEPASSSTSANGDQAD